MGLIPEELPYPIGYSGPLKGQIINRVENISMHNDGNTKINSISLISTEKVSHKEGDLLTMTDVITEIRIQREIL